MLDLSNLRKDYIARSLDISDMSKDPHDQFVHWLNEAVEIMGDEANVMSLATVDGSGRPSNRLVLLKGLIEQKLVFYTNYESRKSQQIGQNKHVALCFWWRELERQVRIEGVTTRASAEVSDAYFKSRPEGSQVGAIASPQSREIQDRQELELRVNAVMDEYHQLQRPEYWGGYLIEPSYYEFWQGRASRLHDRFAYSRQEAGYKVARLAP